MGTVENGVEQVGPDEARRLAEEGAFLLDVREDDEWAAGHIPDAVHLPLSRLGTDHAGVLPSDNRIVAICRMGSRSQRAATALKQAGYDAANLAGGMRAWAAAGCPVVTDGGSPGQVI